MTTEQDLLALSPLDRARLERLADQAGRTPGQGTIPHEEVMAEARRILKSYAKLLLPAS